MQSLPSPPTQEDALLLHQQLVDMHAAAPALVAQAYLPHLTTWLAERYPKVHDDFRQEAAVIAIMSLIKNPHGYQPEKGNLLNYLRMAADGDLLNLLQRERKHRQGRISLQAVEFSGKDGKYLEDSDDATAQLEAQRQQEITARSWETLACVAVNDQERKVLELMRGGEKNRPCLPRLSVSRICPKMNKPIRSISSRNAW